MDIELSIESKEVMKNMDQICVSPGSGFFDILDILEKAKYEGFPGGIVLVVDEVRKLLGTITDGDLRKWLIHKKTMELTALDVMQKNPICFEEGISNREILERLPEELNKRNRASSKYLGKIILVNGQGKPVRIFDYHHLWEQRVATHRHVVVVGLGYVGLTLSLALADEGFLVTGVEADPAKIERLSGGDSYIHEVGLAELLREQWNVNFTARTDFPSNGDVYIISVGTPVEPVNGNPKPIPVLKYLMESAEAISRRIKPGNLVVLRSTVPIGATRRVVLPLLEKHSGLKCGLDFHLAFAPERTAEGKALKELRELPQLIGGFNKDSVEATVALFRELTPNMVRMESLEAAEMAKLINNTYRDYVFAYSNFAAQIASHYNLDVVDVIQAANKGYPRNEVPLPSPGVGGPCLTKDPYIFASSAQMNGGESTIFEKARQINDAMLEDIVSNVLRGLREAGKDPLSCKILLCGLAFKGNPETGDIRSSASLEVARKFRAEVGRVYGQDFIASPEEIRSFAMEPQTLPMGFRNMDAVLFLNNHLQYQRLDVFQMVRSMNPRPVVFDGWHTFRPQDVLNTSPCIYIGLSFTRSSLPESV